MIETPVRARALVTSLAAGVRQARAQNRPVLVSWIESAPTVAPLDFYRRGSSTGTRSFYWERPGERFTIAAVGIAHSLSVDNDDPFGSVAAAWQDLLEDALLAGDAADVAGTGPVAVGGFAFDPLKPRSALWDGFPNGRLDLPRYMLTDTGESGWLTINIVVTAETDTQMEAAGIIEDLARLCQDGESRSADAISERGVVGQAPGNAVRAADSSPGIVELRSPESWKALVGVARDAIRRGEIEKIVLARAVRALSVEGFRPASALARLRAGYSACTLFAAGSGGSTFMGATPERLIRLRDGVVHVDSLAGTIARGRSEDDDRRLGATLLQSAKDRSEHAVVLRMLQERLRVFCTDLTIPAEPGLMKLQNVQHLHTPISGTLRNGHNILALVEQLHPSPAVGGFPIDTARAFIREREELDRGWYAGPIGWIDRNGEGEFAVAIRSALMRGNNATLFAGCGIMGDSDPDAEYEESCLKLQSMLANLGGTAE